MCRAAQYAMIAIESWCIWQLKCNVITSRPAYVVCASALDSIYCICAELDKVWVHYWRDIFMMLRSPMPLLLLLLLRLLLQLQDSKTLALEDMKHELGAENPAMTAVELDEWGKHFSNALCMDYAHCICTASSTTTNQLKLLQWHARTVPLKPCLFYGNECDYG
jgi:hypothetical protein